MARAPVKTAVQKTPLKHARVRQSRPKDTPVNPDTPPNMLLAKGRAGLPGKLTLTIKQSIAQAFEDLGGIEGYVAWGRKNPTLFYDHWIKMLPSEVKSEVTVTTDFASILEKARHRAQPDGVIDVVGERIRDEAQGAGDDE